MTSTTATRISTGTPGLDDLLLGGLPHRRMYLVQGDPGVGKTTLALRFLVAGASAGERTLYITLSETREELTAVAKSHGWSLESLEIYEMSAAEPRANDEDNTLYVPAEVELGERVRSLLVEVDRVKPTRVVLDSCSELRLLAQSPLRFRRQLLALKEDLVHRDCTVLLLENPTSTGGDPLLQSLVHGVIVMEQLAILYGAERRRLRVIKMREVAFRGGYHDFVIRRGGIEVYPRLVASEHPSAKPVLEPVSSGIASLDALLGGGLARSSSTLLIGPAGSGKSSLAMQYASAAAKRGECVTYFTFDEGLETLLGRSDQLGLGLRECVERGLVRFHQVDPAELSPGEFVSVIRHATEVGSTRVLVIDSLNGLLQSMPEERYLITHLHELLSYLRQRGMVTLMLLAQHGFLGDMNVPADISYLADTVLLTRFFEASGRVRKALSVVKKRSGGHEDTIREFAITTEGLLVGEPLTAFHGVLTGVPDYDPNSSTALLPHSHEAPKTK